jgi:hypothetical protein
MIVRPYIHLSTKARSKRSERRAANVLGGRVQPASGALPVAYLKGDVVTSRFMVDDKTTEKASFSVPTALWKKLSREAFMARKRPMFRLEFRKEQVTLYVVDEITMMELLAK